MSGVVQPGDQLTVWPSGQSARVKRIVTFDGDLPRAFAPQSVTLTLDHEIDISRGDVLTHDARRSSDRSSRPSSCGWTNGRSIRVASI